MPGARGAPITPSKHDGGRLARPHQPPSHHHLPWEEGGREGGRRPLSSAYATHTSTRMRFAAHVASIFWGSYVLSAIISRVSGE